MNKKKKGNLKNKLTSENNKMTTEKKKQHKKDNKKQKTKNNNRKNTRTKNWEEDSNPQPLGYQSNTLPHYHIQSNIYGKRNVFILVVIKF